eukprot:GHRR01028761.1.p1 GENE.GHRR01028761.1~~GHRR01028761.1.p1  ORF type:complete len:103 (+),score=18.27 GHRR01028761.1:266-574(+)
MDGLVPLDRLLVTVLVDNETDGMSSPCACSKYTSEFSHMVSEVLGGTANCLDFERICFAGHGLSLLLGAEVGGKQHTLATASAAHMHDVWHWSYLLYASITH